MACARCEVRPMYWAAPLIDPDFRETSHAPPAGFEQPKICAICGSVFYPKTPTSLATTLTRRP